MPTDKLYYSPAALNGAASFIAAYVGGLDVEAETVDVTQNKTYSGIAFDQINPKKNIPCLITTDKSVFYEETIILLYLADQNPKKLAPQIRSMAYFRMGQLISFVGSTITPNLIELIKVAPGGTNEAVATHERQIAHNGFRHLEDQFASNQYPFSTTNSLNVGDIYLYCVLSAANNVGFDLDQFPRLKTFYNHMDNLEVVKAAQTRMLSNPAKVNEVVGIICRC